MAPADADDYGVAASVWSVLMEQFRNLPLPPDGACAGQTVIVSGSNAGMGREAARHFVRLGAGKVILACRNVDAAEEARKDIEASTGISDVAEVWKLDLSSFESVREFAARAAKLDRLDVLVNNAAVLQYVFSVAEGYEEQVTVNVISTFLLTLMVLPVLRKTAKTFNVTPRVVTVASDGAYLTGFPQRTEPNVMEALKKEDADYHGRYNLVKLLEIMISRRLAAEVDASGKGHVIMNSLNPGFARTQLFRNLPWLIGPILMLLGSFAIRTSEMASRTLLHAATAGDETHGRYLSSGVVRIEPGFMLGEEGKQLSDKIYAELMAILEGIEPGVTKNI